MKQRNSFTVPRICAQNLTSNPSPIHTVSNVQLWSQFSWTVFSGVIYRHLRRQAIKTMKAFNTALGIVRNQKIRSAVLLPHLPTQREAGWAEASWCILENDWTGLQLTKSLAKPTSLPQVNHLSIWKLVSLSSCLWTKTLNVTFLNLSLKFSSQDIVESKFSNNQPAFQEHST